MNLDEREQGLLKLVEDYRDAECRALREAARAEAAQLIARTYRDERARLHERVAAERAGARGRINAARAERDTRERAGGERANARLLAAAWPRLREVLVDRWQDPAGRRGWIAAVLAQARQVLPAGVWTLRHAPTGTASEWQALARELTATLDAEPSLVADGAVVAGITVDCAGAVLDGSLEGLLKDRTRIESRLLALISTGTRS
jgi:hypothetical protein